MRTRFFSEADEWTTDGARITAPENIQAIRRVLENEGPIVVEHRFYRGASAPNRIIFEDIDDFLEYLDKQASAGDAFRVWSFERVCTEGERLAYGKCPDDQNRVPKKGAY